MLKLLKRVGSCGGVQVAGEEQLANSSTTSPTRNTTNNPRDTRFDHLSVAGSKPFNPNVVYGEGASNMAASATLPSTSGPAAKTTRFAKKLFSLSKQSPRAAAMAFLESRKNSENTLANADIEKILGYGLTSVNIAMIEYLGKNMPHGFIEDILSKNNPAEHIAILKHYASGSTNLNSNINPNANDSYTTKLGDNDLELILNHPANQGVYLAILDTFGTDLNLEYLTHMIDQVTDIKFYQKILRTFNQKNAPEEFLNEILEKMLKKTNFQKPAEKIDFHKSALDLLPENTENIPEQITEHYLMHEEAKIILMFLGKYFKSLDTDLQTFFAAHINQEVALGFLNLYKNKGVEIPENIKTTFINSIHENVVKDLIREVFLAAKTSAKKSPVFNHMQQEILAQRSESIAALFLEKMLNNQQSIDGIAQAYLAKNHSQSVKMMQTLIGLGDDLSWQAGQVLLSNTNKAVKADVSKLVSQGKIQAFSSNSLFTRAPEPQALVNVLQIA